jgi:hypothetical protein
MLKIEKFVTPSPEQWEIIIEGARNPMNSWDSMDSYSTQVCDYETDHLADYAFFMGEKDHNLLERLAKGGHSHAKYRRMIPVWVTLTAPLYWWKEFDTYKVGTVRNSCSTMHKVHAKEFTLEDFSCDRLTYGVVAVRNPEGFDEKSKIATNPLNVLKGDIDSLNCLRLAYLETKDEDIWYNMIQLLPSSYNQKATVKLNYEVLAAMYKDRRNHKLDEWHRFCDWIEELPYSELITGYSEEVKE